MSRKPRRRLSWYIIWFTILFLIIVSLITIIISLPVWRIKSIKVSGVNILPEINISKMAEPLIGENIFLVDYSVLLTKLSNVNQLEDFGIFRKLPNTLVIRVIERKPFAMIVAQASTIVIDRNGFIIKDKTRNANIENLSSLPVFRGLSSNKILANRLDEDTTNLISLAVNELSRFLPPSNLAFEIKKEDDVILIVEDILDVRFGSIDNISEKIAVLEAILPKIENNWQKIYYIDIRVAANPVIKFK